MGSISSIISDLNFGRTTLLKSFEGCSQRERTEIPVHGDWTVKDILAHIIGWDQYVIEILPLMLQDRAGEISGIDANAFNQKSKVVWQDKTFAQILVEVQTTHQQIVDSLSALDHVEIDKRRDRNKRIITIRSYVIDTLLEHDREHALEIEQWRKQLDQAIDPVSIKEDLQKTRAKFMALLDDFSEDDVLDKSAMGGWSISDLTGHIADWEQIVLKGAYYIYDPSQPAVPQLSSSIDEWNKIMATERVDKSWPENYHDLQRVQKELDEFIATLTPGDWRLRGPYPWSEFGTLAELITTVTEHYTDHIPNLEQWYEKRPQ